MAKAKIASIYDNMDFPPYTFQEYPKQITLPNGRVKVVDNRAAEMNAMVSYQDEERLSEETAERNAMALDLAAEQHARALAEQKQAELQAKLDAIMKGGASAASTQQTQAPEVQAKTQAQAADAAKENPLPPTPTPAVTKK